MMNISKRKRIVEDDADEHMNNKNIGGHDDIISCSHITSGDLIMDILLRIPLISVHRFRSVCKQWYTLISNPDFLQTHSSLSSSFGTNEQLLVCKCKSNLHSYVQLLHLDHDHDHQNPRLVHELSLHLNLLSLIDSCNGLLLLRCAVRDTSSANSINSNSSSTYYVCNPLTNHYLKLPDLIPIPKIHADEKLLAENIIHCRHASLVFDPSITLSYKVIRCLLRDSVGRHIYRHWQIYVYSSETGSWRLKARIPDPNSTVELGLRSVLLNGVLYWSYWTLKGDYSVCLYDNKKEFVWFLELPRKPQGGNVMRNCLYFGECGGRLRLIERYLNSNEDGWRVALNRLPSSFNVMEAEPQTYQQHINAPRYTWRVKYHVYLGWVYDHRPFVIHCYKTKNRRGTEEEPEEEVLMLKLNDNTIASFNLTSNKLKNEATPIPKSICLSDFVDVFAYKPTLFAVSG